MSAARKVSHIYAKRLDPEDIAQAIAQDIIQYPARYKSLNSEWRPLVLKQAGLRWAAKEIASYMEFSGQHLYSSEDLKKLLPRYYSPSVWPNGLSQPDIQDYADVDAFQRAVDEWAENTQLSMSAMDIDYAMGKLTGAQRRVLEKRYRDGKPLLRHYERRLHSIAMRYLTHHVNTRVIQRWYQPDEGIGSRDVLPNTAAIALTRNADGRPPTADPLHRYQALMRGAYPDTKPSRHVVNSPWRQQGPG